MNSKYFVGYTNIDNYIYFLKVVYGKTMTIDDKPVTIKSESDGKIVVKSYGFEYNGVFKDDVFLGTATIVSDGKRLSEGKFVTSIINKHEYDSINTYHTGWEWLLRKITPIKPKIYKELSSPIKIITVMAFNICSTFLWTGESGIDKVADIIKDNGADIVLLQEIGKSGMDKLAKRLSGYNSEYAGGIVTKYKINKVYNRSTFSPIYGVQLQIDSKTKLRVFNSHLEDKAYHDIKRAKYFQLPHLKYGLYTDVYSKTKDPELPTIMAGDHNIASHLDEKEPWPVSKELYKDGWIDTYREVNKVPSTDLDVTYPNCATIKKIIQNEIGTEQCAINAKNKYRIDYIYAKNGKTATLRPIESEILRNSDGKWPSDHNAVLSKILILT